MTFTYNQISPMSKDTKAMVIKDIISGIAKISGLPKDATVLKSFKDSFGGKWNDSFISSGKRSNGVENAKSIGVEKFYTDTKNAIAKMTKEQRSLIVFYIRNDA